MGERSKMLLFILIPLIIAIASATVVTKEATSTKFHKKAIESLEDKRTNVLELMAACTATSAAITLIPGDAGTPIADKLADLSTYFIIVISAIYLEKYLLTITGYAAFSILIPLACLCWIVAVVLKNRSWAYLSLKMALFGIAIFLIVPISLKMSGVIEDTYQTSIEETVNSAKKTNKEIEEGSKDEGFWQGIWSRISSEAEGISEELKDTLNNMVEAIAVMLVTSCLIPILVLVFFFWLIKMVLGVDMDFSKNEKVKGYLKRGRGRKALVDKSQ